MYNILYMLNDIHTYEMMYSFISISNKIT